MEIPNVDDHVSKLEHMGKETVKKLQDIKGAAIQAGVDINIPENCINKGEAHRLYLIQMLWLIPQRICRRIFSRAMCSGVGAFAVLLKIQHEAERQTALMLRLAVLWQHIHGCQSTSSCSTSAFCLVLCVDLE